jgi:hypothetical protein
MQVSIPENKVTVVTRSTAPHALGSRFKFAKRKIHVATQHSPLERTVFLTLLCASRLGGLTLTSSIAGAGIETSVKSLCE